MTLQIGIYRGVSEAVYHADPAPLPSLSHSIIRLLLGQTPRHAWFAHPRLNSMRENQKSTQEQEEGTILHTLVLGRGAKIVELDYDNWKLKEAQRLRAEAREAGAVPVLAWRSAELERVASSVREQLASHRDAAGALDEGDPEVAMIWREGRTWCRGLVDWLRPDPSDFLYDLKFVSRSASPDVWERTMVNDYATQEAFYLRGSRKLGLKPRGMRFIVCETAPPYGMCVYTSAPSLLAAAEADIDEALALWDKCLSTDIWPGYPRYVCHVECPPWRSMKSEQRRDIAQIMGQFEEDEAA